MNVAIFSMDKKEEGSVQLPEQFFENVSQNLIARAVIALQLSHRQPYGSHPGAGTRVSSQVSRRRRDYRGSYGKGISRVPRKVLSKRGSQFFWVGAQSPHTVKGRRAHPPKAFQNTERKINKKENRKAIRCALSATMLKEYALKRGHIVPAGYPFAISDKFTSIGKTKEAVKQLTLLGLGPELARSAQKKIRAGKGKRRGRKHDYKSGPLIIVAEKCSLQRAAANIPGVEVAEVGKLNAELLAPGANPGRLSVFTVSAIEKLKKEKLFM